MTLSTNVLSNTIVSFPLVNNSSPLHHCRLLVIIRSRRDLSIGSIYKRKVPTYVDQKQLIYPSNANISCNKSSSTNSFPYRMTFSRIRCTCLETMDTISMTVMVVPKSISFIIVKVFEDKDWI